MNTQILDRSDSRIRSVRTKTLTVAAYGLCLLLAGLAGPLATHAAPNIVLISIDDLGFADISAFGQNRYQTPNLERMAREGRRFTSFYVAASVCTPSRAGLMTGAYPARVDMLTNDLTMDSVNHLVLFPGDRKGLNPDEVTMAEVLQERGYATSCVGKWHLGDQPPFLPTRQGFEEYYGIPFSNDMGRMKPFFVLTPLVRGERVAKELEDSEQDTLTQIYTNEALGFIERNAHRPFFLYLPHSMVHRPHHRSDAFKDKSGKGVYGDVVMEVDWSVGRILDKLIELEIAENTLVLFTSDNGGPYRGSTQSYSANTPFSGGKGSAAEGGFRVPTIAWQPGTVPAGTEVSQMASTLDLLPTFAALAGKPYQPKNKIDGVDISELLTAPSPASSPRRTFAFYTGIQDPNAPHTNRLNAVREDRWKYYLKPQRFRQAESDAEVQVPAGALFDLDADPAELRNVAAEHPDVVKRMQALAHSFIAELGDEDKAGSGVRKAAYFEGARPMNP